MRSLRRSGFSMVEVLMSLFLMAICFAPIIDLLGTSRRVSNIASHQVTAAGEAQTLVDGLTALEPSDLPPGAAAAAHVVVLSDGHGGLSGGSPRWQELVAYFAERRSEGVERTIETVAMGPDRLLVKVTVKYTRSPLAKEGAGEISMVGLVVRRS